ncbi:MAG: helix-turn-helix transcriptional regulator [Clostridia bacterium]|nr:helix-turn-helix transcriptional regulator [Clostridia bacterium]
MFVSNKELLFSNISTLTKRHNKKIGDVEKEAGVSAGYFSRVAKNKYKASLSIESLIKVANLFDISVDALLFTKLNNSNSSEAYILNFICNLIRLTEGGEINWQTLVTDTFINPKCKASEQYKSNPLFQFDHDAYETYDLIDKNEIVYPSKFHKDCIAVPHDYVFTAMIEDVGEICYMHNRIFRQEAAKACEIDYELYIIDRQKQTVTPICCTLLEDASNEEKSRNLDLEVYMYRLFDVVEKKTKTPNMDSDLYSFINKFNNKFSK